MVDISLIYINYYSLNERNLSPKFSCIDFLKYILFKVLNIVMGNISVQCSLCLETANIFKSDIRLHTLVYPVVAQDNNHKPRSPPKGNLKLPNPIYHNEIRRTSETKNRQL